MNFRSYLFFLFLFLLPLIVLSQSDDLKSLQGAWETTMANPDGDITFVSVISDSYSSITRFNKVEKAFYGTSGGAITVGDGQINLTYEYYFTDSSRVGTIEVLNYSINGDEMTVDGFPNKWRRLDAGQPGALANAWLITGRKRNGEMTQRKPGPRKTMKILSGTRFQWIAYNVETKQFMGTGGGTYTTVDGVYTENIDFFSRDNSRVGASLEFDYELKDGHWHHSGLSSKGSPIYEVWSPRSDVEKGN
jgi:hypothetical protein